MATDKRERRKAILRAVAKFRNVKPDAEVDGEPAYSAKVLHAASEQLDKDLDFIFDRFGGK